MTMDLLSAVGVVVVLCAASVLPISGQRQTLMFCTELSLLNQTEVAISFSSGGTFTQHRHCSCHVSPVSPAALLQVSTLLTRTRAGDNGDDPTYGQDQGLGPGGRSRDKSNSTGHKCDPFVSMMMMGGDPLHQCTGTTPNHTRLDVAMDRGQRYHVSLTNHRMVNIEAQMTIRAQSGVVSVVCKQETEPAPQSEMCPCGYPGMYVAPLGPPGGGGDISTGTRLTVAFVCVAVLLIIIAVVAGLWWWRRKRQAGEKDLEVVPPGGMATENQAYAPSNNASRSSGLDRNPDRNPERGDHNGPRYENGPFDQDPELNLDLRTTPITKPLAKGSTDSGLYSLPSDKHIRPNNNSAPYQHAPANTIGPDQMYNPMAPSKSNSSLTGQGALHGSFDQLSPADVDALYAKPNKPNRNMPPPSSGHPAPTRSASHDALNTAPHKTSMASLGSKSLNTSEPAVETDV